MGLLGDTLPNWLPDDPAKKDAMRAGLMQFGAALMGGKGNFGQILGGGIMSGTQGYSGAMESQQKQALQEAQMGHYTAQNESMKVKDDVSKRKQLMLDRVFNPSEVAGLPQLAASALAQGGAAGSFGPTIANAQRMDTMPLSALPQRGGVSNMTIDQVAALKAVGVDLSSEYKMANEGFERKQGSTYVMPGGAEQSYAKLDNGQVQAPNGTISNAPGYVGAMSEAERAKADAQEGAKAATEILDPSKFVGADGRPMVDTRAGYIRKINELPKIGAPAPAIQPPKAAPATAPAKFPTVTPQQQNRRDGDRLAILNDERTRITNPADLAAIDREIAGVKGQPAAAPVLQSAAESKAQTGAVDTSLKAGQNLNDNWIKEVHNPVQADGKAARSTLTQLETIKHINFSSGWGAETKAGAANILASLGVKDAGKYASQAQTFQQVAMERNMTMLSAQAGPQTEGDSQRAQQTFMKLSNTPAANQFIADLTGANARVSAKRAAFYNEALPLARTQGDLTEIDRRWSKIQPSIWSDAALSKYKGK